jgi:hypothetical protein
MEESSVGQNGKEVRESQADFWWTFFNARRIANTNFLQQAESHLKNS